MPRRPGLSDPFAVLGLPPTADADEVRAARRRLALAEHPDRGGSADRMQAINVAFEEAMELVAARALAGPATAAPSPSPTTPAPDTPSPQPAPSP